MPLVASALLPHAPLLAPPVGRDHRGQLRRTLDTLRRIAEELYALKPSLIVILTPHGPRTDGSFFVNVADRFSLGLQQFGDFVSTLSVPGDPRFAHRLRRTAMTHQFPLTLGTVPRADYGTTVPLLFLSETLERASVVPLSIATLPIEVHERFGRILADAAVSDRARVAIIGSIELGHGARTNGGRATAPREYDRRVLQAARRGRLEEALGLDERLVDAATTCSHRVLALFSGVFHRRTPRPNLLSYEAPFGVGELAALYPIL